MIKVHFLNFFEKSFSGFFSTKLMQLIKKDNILGAPIKI